MDEHNIICGWLYSKDYLKRPRNLPLQAEAIQPALTKSTTTIYQIQRTKATETPTQVKAEIQQRKYIDPPV